MMPEPVNPIAFKVKRNKLAIEGRIKRAIVKRDGRAIVIRNKLAEICYGYPE
jgi:hypothetical protein